MSVSCLDKGRKPAKDENIPHHWIFGIKHEIHFTNQRIVKKFLASLSKAGLKGTVSTIDKNTGKERLVGLDCRKGKTVNK